MTEIVILPRAKEDLRSIWRFTSNRWGRAQADRYIRRLHTAFTYVAGDLRRATPCGEVKVNLLKYTIGLHVAFVRSDEAGLVVVRVLHGSMDPKLHL